MLIFNRIISQFIAHKQFLKSTIDFPTLRPENYYSSGRSSFQQLYEHIFNIDSINNVDIVKLSNQSLIISLYLNYYSLINTTIINSLRNVLQNNQINVKFLNDVQYKVNYDNNKIKTITILPFILFAHSFDYQYNGGDININNLYTYIMKNISDYYTSYGGNIGQNLYLNIFVLIEPTIVNISSQNSISSIDSYIIHPLYPSETNTTTLLTDSFIEFTNSNQYGNQLMSLVQSLYTKINNIVTFFKYVVKNSMLSWLSVSGGQSLILYVFETLEELYKYYNIMFNIIHTNQYVNNVETIIKQLQLIDKQVSYYYQIYVKQKQYMDVVLSPNTSLFKTASDMVSVLLKFTTNTIQNNLTIDDIESSQFLSDLCYNNFTSETISSFVEQIKRIIFVYIRQVENKYYYKYAFTIIKYLEQFFNELLTQYLILKNSGISQESIDNQMISYIEILVKKYEKYVKLYINQSLFEQVDLLLILSTFILKFTKMVYFDMDLMTPIPKQSISPTVIYKISTNKSQDYLNTITIQHNNNIMTFEKYLNNLYIHKVQTWDLSTFSNYKYLVYITSIPVSQIFESYLSNNQ